MNMNIHGTKSIKMERKKFGGALPFTCLKITIVAQDGVTHEINVYHAIDDDIEVEDKGVTYDGT